MNDNLIKLLFRRLGHAELRMIYHSLVSGDTMQYEMAAIECNIIKSKLNKHKEFQLNAINTLFKCPYAL